MIKKIFLGGAFTGATAKQLAEYEELKQCIRQNFSGVQIIDPNDIDEFKLQYLKQHPNISEKELYTAMVKFDLNAVKNCDLMIANVSKRSTGLGLELGTILSGSNKVLLVAESGAEVSNMLVGAFKNDVQYYKDFEDLKHIVSEYLTKLNKTTSIDNSSQTLDK